MHGLRENFFFMEVAKKMPKKQQSKKKKPKVRTIIKERINPIYKQVSSGFPAPKFSYKYLHYLHTLLDPNSTSSCRIPDDVVVPTATYKSIVRETIKIDYNTNPKGLFSILIQPKLGSLDAGNQDAFKANYAISKPNITDVNDNTQYDYYNDKNLSRLTSAPNLIFQSSGQSVAPLLITQYPLYNSSLYPGSGLADNTVKTVQIVPNSSNLRWVNPQLDLPLNLPMGYDINGNPVAGPVLSAGSYGQQLSPWFTGVSGWHDLHPTIINTGGFLAAGATSLTLIEMDSASKNITGWALSRSGAGDLWAGSFRENINFYKEPGWNNAAHGFDWPASVASINQSVVFNVMFRVNLDPKKMYQVLYYTQPNTYPVPAGAIIQNFSLYSIPVPSNYPTDALLQKVRPVAMSALLHPIAPKLLTGGQLMSISANSGQLETLWNNDRNYDSLSAQSIEKGSASFGADVGSYAYWLSTDSQSRNLLTPTATSDFDYGGIIFSGTVSPSLINNSQLSAFNLTIITHYEYTSTSRILTQQACKGNLGLFSEVQSSLGSAEKVFPNQSHTRDIKEILGRVMFPMSNFFPGETLKKRVGGSFRFGLDMLKFVPGLEGADDIIAMANGLMELAEM